MNQTWVSCQLYLSDCLMEDPRTFLCNIFISHTVFCTVDMFAGLSFILLLLSQMFSKKQILYVCEVHWSWSVSDSHDQLCKISNGSSRHKLISITTGWERGFPISAGLQSVENNSKDLKTSVYLYFIRKCWIDSFGLDLPPVIDLKKKWLAIA